MSHLTAFDFRGCIKIKNILCTGQIDYFRDAFYGNYTKVKNEMRVSK